MNPYLKALIILVVVVVVLVTAALLAVYVIPALPQWVVRTGGVILVLAIMYCLILLCIDL